MFQNRCRGNFSLFCEQFLKKKQDKAQKLILKDLVLPTTKGLFPLSTCENVQMWRLVLKLDLKLVFLKDLVQRDFSSHAYTLFKLVHVQP
jgi:hypothetical protein